MTITLKKMFAILLAMFLLATLFSCSKNEEESEFSEEEDAEEMVQAVSHIVVCHRTVACILKQRHLVSH